MKTLKIILVIIAVIIAIPLIAALFAPKSYVVEREINISRPKEVVFDFIKFLKNQNEYSKWAKMDPDMIQNYSGIDGTVGFVSSWESHQKEVGKGQQSITKIIEGERVDFALHFIEPFEGKADAYILTETLSENETRVKWGFLGSMNYPANIMLLLMDMDKTIGNDLETGLVNLKNIMEK